MDTSPPVATRTIDSFVLPDTTTTDEIEPSSPAPPEGVEGTLMPGPSAPLSRFDPQRTGNIDSSEFPTSSTRSVGTSFTMENSYGPSEVRSGITNAVNADSQARASTSPAVVTVTVGPSDSPTSAGSKSPAAAIAGGVVSGDHGCAQGPLSANSRLESWWS
jgi:hypothetical protein